MTDNELILFSNGWSKLPKYARKFIQFLLNCELNEKENRSWRGNFVKLSKVLKIENCDISNFRKYIMSAIEQGIIVRKETTRFDIEFSLPKNWKKKIIEIA